LSGFYQICNIGAVPSISRLVYLYGSSRAGLEQVYSKTGTQLHRDNQTKINTNQLDSGVRWSKVKVTARSNALSRRGI